MPGSAPTGLRKTGGPQVSRISGNESSTTTGNAEGSTLRKTLGCLLADELGFGYGGWDRATA
jgi:hypothetical protein